LLLDGAGNVKNRYAYDAWGNLIEYEEAVPNPFTWNGAYGYEYIPLTGLYHVGAREYDPRTGRWLQRDPIEASSGDPNLWRYCGNDPLNEVDSGFIAESKQGSQLSQSKKQAQNAAQGNPPGTEICPGCNGTGIECNGIHRQRTLLPDGRGGVVESETRWFFYCDECNGLGYCLKNGWSGRHESSIVAKIQGGEEKDVKSDERKQVNAVGQEHGCHTCGTKTASGVYIPDHCPPSTLYRNDGPSGSRQSPPLQKLRPHCQKCSKRQGGKVGGHKRKLDSWGWNAPKGGPFKPCTNHT